MAEQVPAYQALITEIADLEAQRDALSDQLRDINIQLDRKRILLNGTNEMLQSPELIDNMEMMIQAIRAAQNQ
jgi:hypothetical protein